MKDIDLALGGHEIGKLTVCRISIVEKADDGNGITLGSIDLDADQLSNLLLNAAEYRKQMEPPVPERLDPGRPIFKDSTFSPRVMLGQTQLVTGPGVYLAFRHAGFGWLAMSFSVKEAGALLELLAQAVIRATPGKPGLILP